MREAEALWIARVRFDFGERYTDLNQAKDVNSACVSWSIPGIELRREYRCKIWARPCAASEFDVERVERKYEVDDN